jgi:putative ABC transport system permease protein
MKALRLLRQSLMGLRRHPLRSLFVMLGSVLGVAALTFVLGVGRGAQRKMVSTMRQIFGDSSVIIMAGGHRIVGGPRGETARLTMDDIQSVVAELPWIEAWDPQQSVSTTVRHGNASARVRILGQSERSARVWSRSVTEGEYFSVSAVNRLDRVALVGRTVVRDLFGGKDPLQAEILIDAVPFTVVGVLEPFGTDIHGMDRDNEIVVPVSTLMRRVQNVDTIQLAKLLIPADRRLEEVEENVRKILRERHGLVAGQPDDFALISPVEVRRMAGKVTRVLSLYLPLAAGVVLLVGSLIAAMLMLGAVTARTSEIGLRRAVGAEPKDIALQFLLETTVSLFLGGLFGILLGVLAARVVQLHVKVESEFSAGVFLLSLLGCAVAGFLAGVLPARRAAALPPVDALR